MSMVKNKA